MQVVPPDQPVHTLEYTDADQLEAYIPPDLDPGLPGVPHVEYDYNADGQLEFITLPNPLHAIDLVYDTGASGRLTSITYPEGVLEFTYDDDPVNGTGTRNLQAIDTDEQTLTFCYDGQFVTGLTWSRAVTGHIQLSYDDDFLLGMFLINMSRVGYYGYPQILRRPVISPKTRGRSVTGSCGLISQG